MTTRNEPTGLEPIPAHVRSLKEHTASVHNAHDQEQLRDQEKRMNLVQQELTTSLRNHWLGLYYDSPSRLPTDAATGQKVVMSDRYIWNSLLPLLEGTPTEVQEKLTDENGIFCMSEELATSFAEKIKSYNDVPFVVEPVVSETESQQKRSTPLSDGIKHVYRTSADAATKAEQQIKDALQRIKDSAASRINKNVSVQGSPEPDASSAPEITADSETLLHNTVERVKEAADAKGRLESLQLLWDKDPTLSSIKSRKLKADKIYFDITLDYETAEDLYRGIINDLRQYIETHGETLQLAMTPEYTKDNFVAKCIDVSVDGGTYRDPNDLSDRGNHGVCRTLDQITKRHTYLAENGLLNPDQDAAFVQLEAFGGQNPDKALLVLDEQSNVYETAKELIHEINYWMFCALPSSEIVFNSSHADPNFEGNWHRHVGFSDPRLKNASSTMLDAYLSMPTVPKPDDMISTYENKLVVFRNPETQSYLATYRPKSFDGDVPVITSDSASEPRTMDLGDLETHLERSPHINFKTQIRDGETIKKVLQEAASMHKFEPALLNSEEITDITSPHSPFRELWTRLKDQMEQTTAHAIRKTQAIGQLRKTLDQGLKDYLKLRDIREKRGLFERVKQQAESIIPLGSPTAPDSIPAVERAEGSGQNDQSEQEVGDLDAGEINRLSGLLDSSGIDNEVDAHKILFAISRSDSDVQGLKNKFEDYINIEFNLESITVLITDKTDLQLLLINLPSDLKVSQRWVDYTIKKSEISALTLFGFNSILQDEANKDIVINLSSEEIYNNITSKDTPFAHGVVINSFGIGALKTSQLSQPILNTIFANKDVSVEELQALVMDFTDTAFANRLLTAIEQAKQQASQDRKGELESMETNLSNLLQAQEIDNDENAEDVTTKTQIMKLIDDTAPKERWDGFDAWANDEKSKLENSGQKPVDKAELAYAILEMWSKRDPPFELKSESLKKMRSSDDKVGAALALAERILGQNES